MAIAQGPVAEGMKYYQKAMKIAKADYAYIDLWHPNINWIVKKCIQGFIVYPNGSFLGIKDLRSACHGQ